MGCVRLMVLLCCVLAAAGIARAFSLREIAWLVVFTFGTLTVVGVLAEIAVGKPSRDGKPRWPCAFKG